MLTSKSPYCCNYNAIQ